MTPPVLKCIIMTMKPQDCLRFGPSGVGSVLLWSLILLIGIGSVYAEPKPHAISLNSPYAGCSPEKKVALLPSLPKDNQEELEGMSLKGISRSAHISIPAKTDPDSFKSLLGYSGLFYNTEELDGHPKVLSNTLYEWPQETWKVSGLVRNQSCDTVHISTLGAKLLGVRGEVLQVVEAVYPVKDLRPGEPGPFTVEAPIQSESVKAVQWILETEKTSHVPARSLALSVYEDRRVGSVYSLYGRVKNLGTESAEDSHIVAAWLNSDGKVIYVDQPKIRLVSDPTKAQDYVTLAPGDFDDFFYSVDSPAIVSFLEKSRVILWGASN